MTGRPPPTDHLAALPSSQPAPAPALLPVSGLPLPAGVTLEEPLCPLCGADERRHLLATPDLLLGKPGRFGVVRCTRCGLVYSSPRPTNDSLAFYYEGAYSGAAEQAMRRAQTEGPAALLQHARWGQLRLHVRLRPEDRLLDVGCGYGAFLRLMKRKTGCHIHGVDMDAGSLRGSVVAAEAELHHGDLTSAAYPSGHFAAVTLLHSLEHMADPLAVLREVHRILRPGGVVMVEAPNFNGILRRVFGRCWFPLLMPQHLLHLEPRTLRRLLAEAGFRQLRNLRPCWAPGELTFSLGVWLRHRLGRMPAEESPASGEQPARGRPRLAERLCGLALLAIFLLVDLPLSGLLRFLHLSGHMLAVARRGGQGELRVGAGPRAGTGTGPAQRPVPARTPGSTAADELRPLPATRLPTGEEQP